jgi:cysteine desulfurase/selenocysteine lyase
LCTQLNDDVAILAIAHVSNALGNIYPLERIVAEANKNDILSVVDGTQALAHIAVDVQKLDCDFYVASAHKMYGPTGVGMLYGKKENLHALLPSKLGGEMLIDASFHNFESAEPPLKFEAGTPNIAGVIGFATAAHFIQQNLADIQAHENKLKALLLSSLLDKNDIKVWGNNAHSATQENSIGTVSLSFNEVNINDVAQYLFQSNIAVRIGHHCAMPLMKVLGIDGTLRVSIACYTSKDDVSYFIQQLQTALSTLKADKSDNVEFKGHGNLLEDSQPTNAILPIASKVASSKGWDNQYRQLLLASKSLRTLVIEERTSTNLLKGCESDVWLAHTSDGLRAYSESKVIRGILALLLEKAQSLGKAANQFDYSSYLEDLHLTQYFSQGRRDGVGHVIERIKQLTQISTQD